METRYELLSASISSMYHDIQKIERVEMAKFGLKGPHAQCILALSRFPEGMTVSQLCEICDKDKAAVYAEVLYDQALIIADLPVPDPARYAELVCSLME